MSDEETLASTQIFLDFPRDFLRRVAARAESRRYTAGEVIVHEHDPADAFYVLKAGRIEVVHGEGTPAEVVVTRMEPGTFFGEMAIVTEGTRTATVRACEESECLVLSKAAFEAELRSHPHEAAVLMPRLARRLYALRRA